ncbi:hypothetical protein PIB30_086206 [Stylosanthes scabra]|uniref:Kinetochore protein Spc24 n=1 Tax=Stylosanthes scabra TaxID=79078 RepID=A0ABU6URW2_9FABA|nr:hypothetical protein [Stylosanthes scabra]
MADSSRTIEVEKLISWSDDLVKVLQDQRDLDNLAMCLQRTTSLSSTCNSDLNHVRNLLQDCQKKIEACKQKKEEARCETASDAELDLLQRELYEELEKENLLKEELRAIGVEFNDLMQQQNSVQERKKALLKIDQDKRRKEKLLSMYACVSNIFPDLDDHSKISGYIVDKDKNAAEKFEYDTSTMTPLDVCNEIWKTISADLC